MHEDDHGLRFHAHRVPADDVGHGVPLRHELVLHAGRRVVRRHAGSVGVTQVRAQAVQGQVPQAPRDEYVSRNLRHVPWTLSACSRDHAPRLKRGLGACRHVDWLALTPDLQLQRERPRRRVTDAGRAWREPVTAGARQCGSLACVEWVGSERPGRAELGREARLGPGGGRRSSTTRATRCTATRAPARTTCTTA